MAIKEIKVPNIGGAVDVEVIEVLVSPGNYIKQETSLITLESDKASMEIPSPDEGVVDSILVKVGDKVSEGSVILTLKLDAAKTEPKIEPVAQAVSSVGTRAHVSEDEQPALGEAVDKPVGGSDLVHAGPAVRRIAREFGIDLTCIAGSGAKGRILAEDLQAFVKSALKQTTAGPGLQVAKMPEIDFTKFGEVEKVGLNKIKKLTGANVHRSWVTVPHVTQFIQADITEMEAFRKQNKFQAEQQGAKLTILVFIMKAVVAALREFPYMNASLDAHGENLILKKYFNLGIAVDTPNGLVVPVVKAVDQKGMIELAVELAQISQKAKQKGLMPDDMAGSCFTISSLGGIGGTAFTPIVNAPDVAILGVSKAAMTPVYDKGQFVPRLMLPLSLSYDHRVIDGALGARFAVFLANCLSDIRTLLL